MKRYVGSVLIAGVLTSPLLSRAEEAVKLTVRPAVANARGDTRLRVRIARNAMNRVLMWEIDGVDYYRSSSMQLNGASSPRNYLFVVRDLPAGEFEVRALVRRIDDTTAMDRGSLHVVGGPR